MAIVDLGAVFGVAMRDFIAGLNQPTGRLGVGVRL